MTILDPMKTSQFNINPLLFTGSVNLILIFIMGLLIATWANASEPLNIKPHETPDACHANRAQVRVTINGVGSGGVLNIGLYDDPDNFLFKKGRKRTVRIPATEGQHRVCINLEQPGTYAVATYHDMDANRKLKMRWNMLPGEPFGLSNNPEQHIGFPKFNDSAFTTTMGSLGADIMTDFKQP